MAFGVRHESLGVLLAPYCSSQDLELAAFPWGALSQLSGAQPSGLVWHVPSAEGTSVTCPWKGAVSRCSSLLVALVIDFTWSPVTLCTYITPAFACSSAVTPSTGVRAPQGQGCSSWKLLSPQNPEERMAWSRVRYKFVWWIKTFLGGHLIPLSKVPTQLCLTLWPQGL